MSTRSIAWGRSSAPPSRAAPRTSTASSFDLKDRDSVERDALTRAVADGVARAQAIATGARVATGQVIRIEEQPQTSVPQPRPVAMMRESVQAAPGAPVPIEAGEIEIRAHVTVTTAIK